MKAFDFTQDLSGVRVVLRAALNAPLEKGRVTNTFRITQALRTIEALASRGARTTVLAHIGREKTMSLRPVWEEMKQHTSLPIQFVDDTAHNTALQAVNNLQNGGVLLLENVRREQGETENSEALAKTFASFGDVFINDAFADSHRSHASIVGIPRFIPSFAGPNFMDEYNGILPARTPLSPSLAIIGGAKFLTKQPLIVQLLATYDHVFIGGALANDFLLAKGYEVGKSLVSHSPEIKELLQNEKLILPEDVVVLGPNGVETKHVQDVHASDSIFDVGPRSIELLTPYIKNAASILWNGPLGNFENGYTDATETIAKKIAAHKGTSIIGGGDTVTAIHNLNISDKFTHVSTAGGAMLDFIAHGTLVGIDALT